ncbi:MAG: diaminopimelate dehydrogenase [Oscillospiraceae bacterium]|nr:diaminopimelate dehydrogenase [Oscillospiraceae bacterium]
MKKMQIGIVGYGNIGRGAEKAVLAAPDMELRAIFTRRDVQSIKPISNAPVLPIEAAEKMVGEIDCMILCGGSASDLAEQAPMFAKNFNIVDSYDTHAKIPEYLAEVDKAAVSTTAVISCGWDPGLFSMMRTLFESSLPDGAGYSFWGPGVSQGHSNAVRGVPGVLNAVQYSIPLDSAVESVRNGSRPELSARQKHLRQCYVVAEPGADKQTIEQTIKTMPHFFADYDTTVEFISEAEFAANHKKMPHGGMVLRSGETGGNTQVMEFSLKLESNPEFTASVMIAYARAAVRLAAEKQFGAKTVFDVPLTYLSEKSRADLIRELL